MAKSFKKRFKKFNKNINEVKRSHIKYLYARIKVIKSCIKNIYKVWYTKPKDKQDLLKRLIKIYDNSINELEDSFIKIIREYITPEGEENEVVEQNETDN